MQKYAVTAFLCLIAATASAEEIGSVDTAWAIGGNHQVVIEVFDDPKVEGVSCYLSRAKTGGISSMVGLSEDTSDASIACRQVGAIKATEAFQPGEDVFSVSTSPLFKKMHVVRHFDAKRKVFTYLVYSDKLIDGSPKNSISVVPALSWDGVAAELSVTGN